jgi:cyclopropane-fatty-acyl-phospholipid synthase
VTPCLCFRCATAAIPDAANEQHYEVPARFFEAVLGPYLKYSCGYWPSPTTTFEESEVEMLELYCERAQLRDGMNVRNVCSNALVAKLID